MNDWDLSPASRDTRTVYYYSDGSWLDVDELFEQDPEHTYVGVIELPIFTSEDEIDSIVRTTIGG